MKKTLFTTGIIVSMLFLSFSTPENSTLNSPSEIITADLCRTVGDLAYDLAISEGSSTSQARRIRRTVIRNCREANQ